jgi:hypothetical protein
MSRHLYDHRVNFLDVLRTLRDLQVEVVSGITLFSILIWYQFIRYNQLVEEEYIPNGKNQSNSPFIIVRRARAASPSNSPEFLAKRYGTGL